MSSTIIKLIGLKGSAKLLALTVKLKRNNIWITMSKLKLLLNLWKKNQENGETQKKIGEQLKQRYKDGEEE